MQARKNQTMQLLEPIGGSLPPMEGSTMLPQLANTANVVPTKAQLYLEEIMNKKRQQKEQAEAVAKKKLEQIAVAKLEVSKRNVEQIEIRKIQKQ